MIHCVIKNVYANKLFEIGIIYYYFICYVFFWELGAVASNANINYLQGSSTLRALRFNHSLAMEPQSTQDATKRATWILDAKYQKADLQLIVRDNCKHLSADQQKKLL
jgi:hypothetical protein